MPRRAFPKYVKEANGRIVYRPYIKKADRDKFETDKYGYLKPPIKLGVKGDKDQVIYRAYLGACKALEAKAEPNRGTLRWLSEKYMKSRTFNELADDSRRKAPSLNRIMDHPIELNGVAAKLGDIKACDLTTPAMRMLLEDRLAAYKAAGRKGNVQCNREKSHISTIYSWGLQYIEDIGLTRNPCRGIKAFKEKPNQRYVTDAEYLAQIKVAYEIRDYLPVVMRLAYLLASRGIEIPDIKITDCKDEGIRVRRRKGSKDTIVQWSDELRAAYSEAMQLHKSRKISGIWLIPGTKRVGGKLNKSTLDAAMQDLKKEMKAREMEDVYWTLHDLKRKGITDAEDSHIAGHVSPRIMEQYDVNIKKFTPPK